MKKFLILSFLFIACSTSKKASSSKVILVEDVDVFEKYTKNLVFKNGTDEFIGNYHQYIIKISEIIKKTSSEVSFEILGHTDSVGDKNLNLALSQKRAEKVKGLLIKEGCNSSQLLAKGYGETRPLASNKTKEGRKSNRRIEIYMIKKSAD